MAKVSSDIAKQASEFALTFKHYTVDREHGHLEIVFCAGVSLADVREEGYLGWWFEQNGFKVEYKQGDVEYIPNNHKYDRHPKKAVLRNRVTLIADWEED